MLRATESDQYFTIHPEYRNPGNIVTRPVGEEFTSENAPQLDTIESVSELLESMGETEHYD